ncbi:MAG: SpoIIE family protein phosphatase [Chlamydiota bacterium]
MMADSGLSSKHSKEKQYVNEGISEERFVGRLGSRVFLVALVFLVIPLMIYSWVTYLDDFFFKKKTLFEGMVSIATGKSRFADQMVQDRLAELGVAAAAISQSGTDASLKAWLPSLMQALSKDPMVDTAFYQVLGDDSSLLCVAASNYEWVGKKDLFYDEEKKILSQGNGVFLGVDPINQQKQIFISQTVFNATTEKPIGMITLGIDAQKWVEWISILVTSPILFNVSILDENGGVFYSQDKDFNLANMSVFPVSPTGNVEDIFNAASRTPEGKEFLKLWGQHNHNIAVRVPVSGAGFYFLLDSSQQQVTVQPTAEVLGSLIRALILFVLVGGGMAMLITFRISRPLSALYQVMKRVERRDLTARYHQDRMGFEINVIGRVFNRMIDSLLHHMEEARNERISRELLTKELKIGHDIQRSILPKEMPKIPGFDIATGFQGAKEVAGDFYDLFSCEDGELWCAVADAAGKGVSACLYSLCVRSMLRSFQASNVPLDQVVVNTNNLFCLDTGNSGNFVTAWVGAIDRNTRKLTYCSCGHLPSMLLKKDGRVELLGTPGIALGVLPIDSATCVEVQLDPGDVLLLYTDGIIDSQDSFFEFYGRDRLLSSLKEAHHLTAEEIVETIIDRVNNFAQDTPIVDDRTLVVIKVS